MAELRRLGYRRGGSRSAAGAVEEAPFPGNGRTRAGESLDGTAPLCRAMPINAATVIAKPCLLSDLRHLIAL